MVPEDQTLLDQSAIVSRGCRIIVIVNICMLVVAFTSGGLRIYVRAKLLRLFGRDDWAMLASQVLYLLSSVGICTSCALTAHFLEHGVLLIPYMRFLQVARMGFASYIACILAMKLSVALFMDRIFGGHHPKERAAVYFFTSLPLLVGSVLMVMTGATCAYNFRDYTTAACSWYDPFDILNEIFSIFNCISDLFFAGLAFYILWSMNMNRYARISAMILFTIGAVGSIASIMRVISFYEGGSDSMRRVRYIQWSVIEAGTCATAACLFTLRPLFRLSFAQRIGNFLFPSEQTDGQATISIPDTHVAQLRTHGLVQKERKHSQSNTFLFVVNSRQEMPKGRRHSSAEFSSKLDQITP